MWYLTQSLLSSWQHYLDSDDAFTDAAYQSFCSTLAREPVPPTPAMQTGRDFEAMVNRLVSGEPVEPEKGREKWLRAAEQFAAVCKGGQSQTPVSGVIHADGEEFSMYGLCDYVKAGTIYDIKKTTRYEYGKYLHSPQHPAYLAMMPGAHKFTYLIFDGTTCYRETYRREDCRPIEETVAQFARWLKKNGLWPIYLKHWGMTPYRKELIHEF